MKFLVIRKRHLVFTAGVILALAIFWAVNSPPTVAVSVATRQLPIYCVDRNDNVISISFDAAWGDFILRQFQHGSGQCQIIQNELHGKGRVCFGCT